MSTQKPLFIPLRTEYYELFESGRKKAELRKYGPRWNEKTCAIGRPVILSKGYGIKHRVSGKIIDFKKKSASDIDPIHRLAIQTIYGALDIDIAVIYIECDNKQRLLNGTTATTGSVNNYTLTDVLAAKEILRSFPMPRRVKSITFNNSGLIKFMQAAKIDDPPLCNGFLNLTFNGVNCFLVPGQIEEFKINY
ncbi:MAG: hypothetical protein LV471_09140 [Nitrosomonas sp.]|nr:hypothetical protein [Nitrosomonas sp.]